MWGSIELGAQPVAKPAYSSGSPNWRLRLGAGGAASGSGSVVGAGYSSRRSGSGSATTERTGAGGSSGLGSASLPDAAATGEARGVRRVRGRVVLAGATPTV